MILWFVLIIFCSITKVPDQVSLSSFPVRHLQMLGGFYEFSTQNSLLQSGQSQLSQPQPHGPPLDLFQQFHVLMLGTPELYAGLQVESHKSRVEQENHLWSTSYAAFWSCPGFGWYSVLQLRTAGSCWFFYWPLSPSIPQQAVEKVTKLYTLSLHYQATHIVSL